MAKSKSAKLVVGAIVLCLGVVLVTPGQKTYITKDKKISLSMAKQPVGLVFRELMRRYDILIGFEKSPSDFGSYDFDFETNPSEPAAIAQTQVGDLQIDGEVTRTFEAQKYLITLNAKDERLEDVLDSIVSQMAHYQWELNEGVVNIFPTLIRDKKLETLLAMRIDKFTFRAGRPISEITKNLKNLPELRKYLDENNLVFSGVRTGPNVLVRAQYGKRIDQDMSFSNLTFRELLNKITLVKRGSWVVRIVSRPKLGKPQHIDIDI